MIFDFQQSRFVLALFIDANSSFWMDAPIAPLLTAHKRLPDHKRLTDEGEDVFQLRPTEFEHSVWQVGALDINVYVNRLLIPVTFGMIERIRTHLAAVVELARPIEDYERADCDYHGITYKPVDDWLSS